MPSKSEEELYTTERARRKAVVERVEDDKTPFRTVFYFDDRRTRMAVHRETEREACLEADNYVNV